MSENLVDLDGIIKFYNQMKGFGFVAVASLGEDAFLHQSVVSEQMYLSEGQAVKVSLSRNDRGLKVDRLVVV